MKKEYAIFILHSIDNYLKRQNDYSERNHDAIMMAIEALREMSVEEYRQRLMEVFHRTDHDELLTYVVQPKEEEFKSLEDILRQYKFEPRLHGEWKTDGTCSECGVYSSLNKDTTYFCPNCGSDNRPRILDEAIDGEGKDGNVKEGEAVKMGAEVLKEEMICPIYSDNEVKQPCVGCPDCEIVENGKCASCGKPLEKYRLFICKECQKEEGDQNEENHVDGC